MEPIIGHFREFYGYYIMGAFCVLPFIVVFRRVAVPAIMYVIELCIYMGLLHCAIWVIVAVAAWFKDQSTMKRARDLVGDDYNPGWTTPILEFWKREEYNPHWLFYFEIVLFFLVIFLMWRYRPMRMRRPKKAMESKNKKKIGGYDYRKVK